MEYFLKNKKINSQIGIKIDFLHILCYSESKPKGVGSDGNSKRISEQPQTVEG